MRHGTTRADHLHAQQRRAFVLRLRQAGTTYEAIAHAVRRQFGLDAPAGYDRRAAHRDVIRMMRQVEAELTEAAQLVRQMELERLDELQLSIWPATRAGNLDAIHTILRLMERRAGLLNLDAPMKFAQTTPEGTQPPRPAGHRVQRGRVGRAVGDPPGPARLSRLGRQV